MQELINLLDLYAYSAYYSSGKETYMYLKLYKYVLKMIEDMVTE